MYLKPQDVVILLKLGLSTQHGWSRKSGRSDQPAWSYSQVAYELRMSPSEVHKGIKRAVQARLFDMESRSPRLQSFLEFLVHGVKYAYAPDIGGMTRGVPTAFAAPGLRNNLHVGEETYVWPDPEGDSRGLSLSPLYKNVPQAVRGDEVLYRALSALDAIRIGRARERKMGEDVLFDMLNRYE